MNNKQEFLKYISSKGKKQDYIDKSGYLAEHLLMIIGDEPPTAEAIGEFMQNLPAESVTQLVIQAAHQFLRDYADFCEAESPEFVEAYREYTRQALEEPKRNEMRAFREAIMLIPEGTKIAPYYLEGTMLSNDEYVEAFRHLQEIVCRIYEEIERSSLQDWGWPEWKRLYADGFGHRHVLLLLEAFALNHTIDGGALVVEKNNFYGFDYTRPHKERATKMLRGVCGYGIRYRRSRR